MMKKSKIQLIEKEILDQGENVRITEDFDIGYKYLKGISVLSQIGSNHLFKSFTISGKEIFPKNFEVLFLQSNAVVSPNERFFSLEEIADGKKINIEFQDGGINTDYPYTLRIYLLLENEK